MFRRGALGFLAAIVALTAGACGRADLAPPGISASADFCSVPIDDPVRDVWERFERNAETGVRTCYVNDTVYELKPGTLCGSSISSETERVFPGRSLEDAFLACTATLKNPSGAIPALAFLLAEQGDEEDRANFHRLYFDLRALATAGGLPVSFFGQVDRLICMETADLDVLGAYIEEVGTDLSPSISLVTNTQGCVVLERQEQGLGWPVIDRSALAR